MNADRGIRSSKGLRNSRCILGRLVNNFLKTTQCVSNTLSVYVASRRVVKRVDEPYSMRPNKISMFLMKSLKSNNRALTLGQRMSMQEIQNVDPRVRNHFSRHCQLVLLRRSFHLLPDPTEIGACPHL